MNLDDAACRGMWHLFDSVEPADHRAAKAICMTCPELPPCRRLLAQVRAESMAPGKYHGPQGTWAGQLVGKRRYRRKEAS